MLSDAQIARYSRQILLPAIGGQGQQRLLDARVAIVGDQEAARTAALYLVGAGVGALRCFDRDWSAEELDNYNPDCRITVAALSGVATPAVLDGCVLVDASGSPTLSKQLNAYSCAAGTPLIWGSSAGSVAQATVFAGYRPDAPCFECWRSRPVAAGADLVTAAPLSRPVEALLGTLLATEVIKLVLGLEPTLVGQLVRWDGLEIDIEQAFVAKVPDCPVCARTGVPTF